MSGQVPPLLWFLFWVGLSVGVLGFGFFMAIIIHRGHMKTLEILRFYAEKGIEPPPAVLEMLTRQAGDSDAARAGRDAGIKAANFIALLVSACVAGGIAWWRLSAGGPQLVIYFFALCAVFFGMRSLWYLITSLTPSDK
jgi:hypothetical protein